MKFKKIKTIHSLLYLLYVSPFKVIFSGVFILKITNFLNEYTFIFLILSSIFSLVFAIKNENRQWVKTIKEEGDVILTDSQIEMGEEKISLKKCSNIKLQHEGKNKFGYFFIIFLYKHKSHSIMFWVAEGQISKIKEFLLDWYSKSIDFKEYDLKNRSYLLNSDLTYNQIQKIKETHNIKGHWI